MTAKEYLNQAYNLKELIASNARQIRDLRNTLKNLGNGFNEKVQGGKPCQGFQAVCDKIMDLELDIKRDTQQMISLLCEIRKTIEKVNNPNEKLLLSLRYLEFAKWDHIARKMRYSERHIKRIHESALSSVEKILKDVT